MSSPVYNWFKIAESVAELFPEDTHIVGLEAGGKKLCISLYQGDLYACAATCPHAGGILAQGYIDPLGYIVCPIHHYKFSLKSGHNSSGEGYHLKTYPVENREDGIYVGIEEKNLFGWFK